MTENGWIVASDLNGTLTTGSPVLAVARWLAKNQPDSYPPLFELRTLLSYLQVKAGLKEIDTWGKEAMSKVLGLVQSPSLQTLGAIMEMWLKPSSGLREELNRFPCFRSIVTKARICISSAQLINLQLINLPEKFPRKVLLELAQR